MKSAQIRAGRAILLWTAEDLARHAKVGVATVRRAEHGSKTTSVVARAIERAFVLHGIAFPDEVTIRMDEQS